MSKHRPSRPEMFLSKFGAHITAVLSGFDRLRLRGTLRLLFHPSAMEAYLRRVGVLLKDFQGYAQSLTHSMIAAAEQLARDLGRPWHYLKSSHTRKEEFVQQILRTNSPVHGLIAVLQCVEPCLSYRMATRPLRLELEPRQCSHLYFYFLHRRVGLCHVRLQSWFPFSIDICLNGRWWLVRQLQEAGIGYRQRDNCLVWVEDAAGAQSLLDAQRRVRWPELPQQLVEPCHPLAEQICRPLALAYYWSLCQSEYATDSVFPDTGASGPTLPALSAAWSGQLELHGYPVPASGRVPERLVDEVISD